MRLTTDTYVPLSVRAAMAEAIKTAEAGSMPLEWAQMHAALDVLADADRIARPLPTREEIANAIHGDQCPDDPDPDECCSCGAGDYYRMGDIVLDLLRGEDSW